MRYKVKRYESQKAFEDGLNQMLADNWLLDSWTVYAAEVIVVFESIPDFSKEPAAVAKIEDWSQCDICHPLNTQTGHYCAKHLPVPVALHPEDFFKGPGGCVSVPNLIETTKEQFQDNQKVLQTLSEKLQDDLEPLPNEAKRYCV